MSVQFPAASNIQPQQQPLVMSEEEGEEALDALYDEFDSLPEEPQNLNDRIDLIIAIRGISSRLQAVYESLEDVPAFVSVFLQEIAARRASLCATSTFYRGQSESVNANAAQSQQPIAREIVDVEDLRHEVEVAERDARRAAQVVRSDQEPAEEVIGIRPAGFIPTPARTQPRGIVQPVAIISPNTAPPSNDPPVSSNGPSQHSRVPR